MTRGNRRDHVLSRTVIIVCLLVLVGSGMSQRPAAGWEMRVCADPNGMPFSNRELEGFDNRVAEVLADELGANLTYDWFTQGPDMVEFRLRTGLCDMIVGVPDGYQDLLTTIAYYRSPYVFIYRADAEHEITSLDDPALEDLRIGLQASGIPPHDALIERRLGDRVVRSFGGPGLHNASQSVGDLVEALAAGEIDVGIAWGPPAGYVADRADIELELAEVTPAFEPPFMSMVFAMTVAVRPGDEALRDRLNAALASRWEEIQAILEDYDVPISRLPPPPTQAERPDVLRIGVVVPGTTGPTLLRSSAFDVAGNAGRMGALLAESDIARSGNSPVAVKVLPANTPTPEAARRAAERLVSTEDVTAIVGGLGQGQARTVAEVAERAGTLFFNIGSSERGLRDECHRTTFHIEASAQMYLDGTVEHYASRGHSRWFVVHEDDGAGEELLEATALAVERRGSGGEIVGSAATAPEQPVYSSELQMAREAEADVILVLLDVTDQVAFIRQKQSLGPAATVALYPHAVTQTRDFIAATSDAADHGAGHRLLLWETTVDEGAMGELNDRYTGRFGTPMDASAWAAYQAVQVVAQAGGEVPDAEVSELLTYLESPKTTFEAKGSELSFSPGGHQLRQPLYVAAVDPSVHWDNTLSQMVAFAQLEAVLPRGGDFQHLGQEAEPVCSDR